jgi:formylmethanofuran dehydrogenase subunit B
MSDSAKPQIFENVPSPFCGIASDDLCIAVEGPDVKVVANGDPVTIAGFEYQGGDGCPRIKGQPVDLAEAVAAAAKIIQAAKLPVFSGFGSDVNETRAAFSLIDRSRGVFDQVRAEGGLRNLLVLSNSGWMATTLAELKNRVEVLVSFGTDIEANFPRFFDRFIWNETTLFGADTRQREIIYIGRAPSGEASISPDGRKPRVIPCRQDDLPKVAAALSALAGGIKLNTDSVAGIPIQDLEFVINRLKTAKYSVVTWAAGQLDFPHAELCVQQLCKAIIKINAETRCAGLPLGGQDGDRTASQVSAWLSGYPTRVSYAKGFPEYDPYHNSLARLLEQGEADAVIWYSSFTASPPPKTQAPTVVIGRDGMQFDAFPDVYIPVGVPGIDQEGLMYRCDNVVAMPLYKLRDSKLPNGADVLKLIEDQITE